MIDTCTHLIVWYNSYHLLKLVELFDPAHGGDEESEENTCSDETRVGYAFVSLTGQPHPHIQQAASTNCVYSCHLKYGRFPSSSLRFQNSHSQLQISRFQLFHYVFYLLDSVRHGDCSRSCLPYSYSYSLVILLYIFKNCSMSKKKSIHHQPVSLFLEQVVGQLVVAVSSREAPEHMVQQSLGTKILDSEYTQCLHPYETKSLLTTQ